MTNDWKGIQEIDAATFISMGESSPRKTPLQRVRITSLSPEQLQAFVDLPLLSHLTHLDLSGNKIGHSGTYSLLMGGAELGQLTHLDLTGNRTLDAIQDLGQSKIVIENLQALRLANNGLSWTMGHVLASLPFDQLRYLDLRGNRIDRAGMKALAKSDHFQPDMTILLDRFQGRFADFQQWARDMRRGSGAARGS
jgi:Leucine-rich repeat (LRR) protein